MSQPVLWEDTIQAGASWSLLLRRGRELHLQDSEGGVNVAALFYNYECPTERYNMPDTLKAQHMAHLTKGFVLYSDMGRILCSITADTRGWHDPLGGHNDARAVRQSTEIQAIRNNATNGTGTRGTTFSPSWENMVSDCAISLPT